MSFERKRKATHAGYTKAMNIVIQEKKRRINTIIGESTHIKLKMIAASTNTTVSDILDDLAKKFISDYGLIKG